jgi:ABC-type bacteriocin/lantibiotic exporter with double-glycine peptidase domain
VLNPSDHNLRAPNFSLYCSLERIQGFVNIEQEPKATEGGNPPAYWPTSGDLVVENLSARYSQDGPKVLDDISFQIKSGERVGVGKFSPEGRFSTFTYIL